MEGFRPVICASIVALHAPALYGVIYGFRHGGFPLAAWIWAFVMWRLSVIGISVGYHRYFTHRSFQCDPWFEKVLCGLGLLAFEGTPTVNGSGIILSIIALRIRKEIRTVPVARYPGIKGFLWGHVGWLFWETERPRGFEISPLAGTSIASWESRYGLIMTVASLLFPAARCRMAGFLARRLYPYRGCMAHHMVRETHFSISSAKRSTNSDVHNPAIKAGTIIGSSPSIHPGKDGIAITTRSQNPAYLGWRWHSLDLGKWTIQLLAAFGLVWSIPKPS